MEAYLLNYEQINVHDLEFRVENQPGDPLIQQTERTYSLMNYFSNSLGKNCVLCHNSRAFYDTEKVTPQWGISSLGISMVQEMNNDYLVPLADVYPENRLGPVHGDAPKAACKTCHKGYQQPLQGSNVISTGLNWLQLELRCTNDGIGANNCNCRTYFDFFQWRQSQMPDLAYCPIGQIRGFHTRFPSCWLQETGVALAQYRCGAF